MPARLSLSAAPTARAAPRPLAALPHANALARLPEPGEFVPLFEAALEALSERLGEDHKRTQRVLSDFIDSCEAAGMVEKAEELRAR